MKKVMVIVVNLLTVIRIVGVFLIVPIFIKYGGVYAAIVSAICYLTDLFDGILARKCHVATFFGSVFDGSADKLFSVANLVVLLTITKLAMIPICCEIIILIIQLIKFSKNVNVQSSKAGKIKTWVVALTVVILYFVTDIKKLTFFSPKFINYVTNLNPIKLYGILFIPLVIFELITLSSYLKFLKTYDPHEKVELPKIDEKLKPATSFKNKWENFCTIWLSNEFYMKYKDCAGLKEIRKFVKNNRY